MRRPAGAATGILRSAIGGASFYLYQATVKDRSAAHVCDSIGGQSINAETARRSLVPTRASGAHDAAPDGITDFGFQVTFTAVVEQPDQITGRNAPACRIFRAHLAGLGLSIDRVPVAER